MDRYIESTDDVYRSYDTESKDVVQFVKHSPASTKRLWGDYVKVDFLNDSYDGNYYMPLWGQGRAIVTSKDYGECIKVLSSGGLLISAIESDAVPSIDYTGPVVTFGEFHSSLSSLVFVFYDGYVVYNVCPDSGELTLSISTISPDVKLMAVQANNRSQSWLLVAYKEEHLDEIVNMLVAFPCKLYMEQPHRSYKFNPRIGMLLEIDNSVPPGIHRLHGSTSNVEYCCEYDKRYKQHIFKEVKKDPMSVGSYEVAPTVQLLTADAHLHNYLSRTWDVPMVVSELIDLTDTQELLNILARGQKADYCLIYNDGKIRVFRAYDVPTYIDVRPLDLIPYFNCNVCTKLLVMLERYAERKSKGSVDK